MERDTRLGKPGSRRTVRAFWLGVTIALGFYVANSSAADDKAGEDGLPPHLAHVPQDAVFFHTLHIAQIWDHPTVKELREKARPLMEEVSSQVFEAQFGLPVADIEHVMRSVANRVGASIIVVGLLLSSALLARVHDLQWLAFGGFCLAVVLGLYMVWKILRTP